MKNYWILTSLMLLLGFKTQAQKLTVTTIYATAQRVTREIPETDRTYSSTTLREVTPRLEPEVLMLSTNKSKLHFRIQGNISSSGHQVRNVSGIRYEKGEQNDKEITLKYYVEIKNKPGKEGALIKGYNYTKDMSYRIPKGVKRLKIELYEDHLNLSAATKSKCIAVKTFDF
ncbi:hypothetical protein [Flavobacterium sp. HSC-61S13]|uniref:hypothetical protein n=1 Tax=Flavobacterium sp. HSC-61S13 TaxID=2910963 RepID=UPI0020A1BA43|nr:hypothetical protein [Flavobacterium sp. HSC-61S13]MCP1997335.1 hypothetical protein [Flavobacterium sp. HSC-61S13]